MKKKALPESALENIPGVGISIARDLRSIGIRSISDLVGKNAESLYQKLCIRQKAQVDRCVLYVFRCAVYFANEEQHEPELLKWWNWKDEEG